MNRIIIASLALSACCAAASAQCPPQRLRSLTMHEADRFGSAMALAGEWLFIGDYGDDLLCPANPECDSGAVWVYRRDALGAWTPTDRIIPHDLVGGDWYGASVATDGSTMVAGAPEFGSFGQGTVRIYELEGDRWRQADELRPAVASDVGFGAQVAIDGDTLVASGPSPISAEIKGGAVSVYRRAGGSWQLAHYLISPAPRRNGNFGSSVAVSGSWIAIGEPGDDSPEIPQGRVYVYEMLPSGELAPPQLLTVSGDPTVDLFGTSLLMDRGSLFVGAPRVILPGIGTGGVFEFQQTAGEWALVRLLQPDDGRGFTGLGHGIAVSDSRVATSTPLISETVLFDRSDGSLIARIRPGAIGAAVAADEQQLFVSRREPSKGAVAIYDIGCTLCPPDYDGDGELTIFDFLAFGNLFAAGDLRADWNGDRELRPGDFLLFQRAFDEGCPDP